MRDLLAINFDLREFSFFLGSTNITRYITSFRLESPLASIGEPYLITGQFQVDLNQAALEDGRTEEFFDELKNPSLWRRGLQQVKISLNGKLLPVCRIESYVWTPGGSGAGNIAQLPSLLKIFNKQELLAVAPRVGGTGLTTIVDKLLNQCNQELGRVGQPSFSYDLPSLNGTFDKPVYFDDAIGLIQDLAGKQKQWLWVDSNERFKWATYRFGGTPSLSRAPSFYQIQRSPDSVNFFAEEVIVGGIKEIAKEPVALEEEGSIGGTRVAVDVTEQGNPRSYSLTTFSTYGDLFGRLADSEGNGLLNAGNVDTPTVEKIETYYFTYATDGNGREYLLSEQKTTQKPRGSVWADLTDNNGDPLIDSISSATVPIVTEISQTYANMRTLQRTWGEVYGGIEDSDGNPIVNDLGKAAIFTIRNQQINEKISQQPPYFISEDSTLPSGQVRSVQPSPPPEAPQPQADLDYETETYTATCNVRGATWSPFNEQTERYDVGFLPSQAIAQDLACFLAQLEASRRDASTYTMSLADEWLNNGCAPFQIANLGDRSCTIDGWVVECTQNGDNGSLKFTFTGNFLGLLPNPVPEPPLPSARVLGAFYIDYAVQPQIWQVGDAISIQFTTIGEIGSVIWINSGLPEGLSLSSTGLLSGTLTVPSTPTSEFITFTIRAVDGATANTDEIEIPYFTAGAPIPDTVEIFTDTFFEKLESKFNKQDPLLDFGGFSFIENLVGDFSDWRFWYQASTGTTLYGEDFVSVWEDQTDHNYNLSRHPDYDGGNRVVNVGLPNNAPAINFKGSYNNAGSFLATQWMQSSILDSSTAFTLKQCYCVMRIPTNPINETNDFLLSNYLDSATARGIISRSSGSPRIPGLDVVRQPVSSGDLAGKAPSYYATGQYNKWIVFSFQIEDGYYRTRINLETPTEVTDGGDLVNFEMPATGRILVGARGQDNGTDSFIPYRTQALPCQVAELLGSAARHEIELEESIIQRLMTKYGIS